MYREREVITNLNWNLKREALSINFRRSWKDKKYRLDAACPIKGFIEWFVNMVQTLRLLSSKEFFVQLNRTNFRVMLHRFNMQISFYCGSCETRSVSTVTALKVTSFVSQNVMNGLTKRCQCGTSRDEGTTEFRLRHFRDVHYGWTRAHSCGETCIIVLQTGVSGYACSLMWVAV
jgi:hypothetical protein